MSEADIIAQARERASEFVVLQKPVFVNGEHGIEFQINMSDSALQRLASEVPRSIRVNTPLRGES